MKTQNILFFWLISLTTLSLLPVSMSLAAGMEEMMRTAEHGNVKAQLKLGQMYYDGKNVKQDYKLAMRWFRLAADQGEAEAQNSVGTLYDNGKGVPKNYQEAANWFRLAADQGHVLARRNLGWMYGKGQGFAKNYVLSYMWHYLAEMAQSKKKGLLDDGVGQCRLCDAVAKHMTPSQIVQAQELAKNWKPEKR